MQPILKVDLTSQKIEQIEIPLEWEKDYLGGASLAARMLYDDLVKELNPLSPQAPLLFLNGPLSGTSGPAVGRFVVCAKSPATGLWGESNCGGFWGPELRKTGFDGIWITGKAEFPVYLWVHNDTVEVLPAKHLWGQDTYAVQTSITRERNNGKVRVAGIGIAGENLLPSALILTDHGRVAGRTGMGAIMGSKNLKAVAVKGTGEVPVADPATFKPLRSEVNRNLAKDNMTQVFREMGSAGAADYFDYLGEMPKKYFSRGYMDEVEKISGATIRDTILVGLSACHACVIACGRVVKLDENSEKQKGPEYETLIGFGPNLWLNDPAFATRMGDICDRYGMDVISVSNTIGLAFALFEMGIIAGENTGGLELVWGDDAVVEKLLHMIPVKEGFGEQLAEGARALGRRYSQEELAVQVNGLEAAYHDPRGASGMAIVYATSPRGACHNQSDYFLVDIGNVEDELGMKLFSREAGQEKAPNVVIHQNWRTLQNSLVACFFGNAMPHEELALINAACGLDWGIEDMLKAGERAWNLKRAINNRLGLTREDDKLPKAFLEPLPDGGAEGFVIDFDAMMEAYYLARGWDAETGYPTPEKLSSLGIGWVVEDLWPKT